MEKYQSIKNWAEDDQPREKLLAKGANHLSNAELVAILIRNGTLQKSALDIARDILALGKNDLSVMGNLSISDFKRIKGVGNAKAVILMAALELGRRRASAIVSPVTGITSSDAAANYLLPLFQDFNHEVFIILYLNNANHIIQHEVISEGGLTGTVADLRIILRKTLERNITKIMVAHNHPSGSVKPSEADKKLTDKIKNGAQLLDIMLLDHIIIGKNTYFSFADKGLL